MCDGIAACVVISTLSTCAALLEPAPTAGSAINPAKGTARQVRSVVLLRGGDPCRQLSANRGRVDARLRSSADPRIVVAVSRRSRVERGRDDDDDHDP